MQILSKLASYNLPSVKEMTRYAGERLATRKSIKAYLPNHAIIHVSGLYKNVSGWKFFMQINSKPKNVPGRCHLPTATSS